CGYSAQDLFKPFLESTDEEVRLETVVALSETATDEATTILSGILNDPSNAPYLRSAAAWALGKIGTEHASEALIAAFKDVDLAIREEALIALGSMGEGVIEKLATEIVADDE